MFDAAFGLRLNTLNPKPIKSLSPFLWFRVLGFTVQGLALPDKAHALPLS